MVDGVRKATESVDTYNCIYDILSNNLTDPLTGRAVAEFIRSGYPNPTEYNSCKAGATWQFPIIVIEIGDSIREPATIDAAQTISKGTIDVTIEVHSAKNQLEKNQLRDAVIHALYSNNETLTTNAALGNMMLLGTTSDTEFLGNHKVRVSRITLRFSRID